MNKYLIIIILVLIGAVLVEWEQMKYANEKWEVAAANMKAYDSQLAAGNEKNIALQLTIEQLGYFKDSVLQELNETRRQLKIKEKDLKAMQAVKSSFSRTDTIQMRDTIFKEPSLSMDTVMGDKWYTLRLGLEYPSMIAIKPEFKSEKHIVVSSKKETIDPPKKFFLLRWLQKKHTVVHIDVIEKNPYVNDESSRFIEIIK
jgi:hypothetical protein